MRASKKKDGPFPTWLSFILDNRIRRRFDPPQKIIEALGIDNNSIVLDFGCGPGFYTIPFAKVAKQVVAVDLQPKMLERLAKKARKQGVKVQTVQSDGKQILLPGNIFDLIFLSHVYHEVPDKPRVLMELRRLLRSNGRLAIMESTKKPIWGPLGPPAMNPEEITEKLRGTGFSSVETKRIGNRALVIGMNRS